MTIKILFLTFIALLSYARTSPLPANVKYDQRQEGDWNVRADLENFVILIIPTSSGQASTGSLGLLDLLSKAVPARFNKRKHIKKVTTQPNTNVETEAFIESKRAPYHVDISRSRTNLAKLHPAENIDDQSEELLVSPSIALVKTDELPLLHAHKNARMSRGFVLSMPLEVEEVLHVKEAKKEIKKKTSGDKKEIKKEKLTLLGAELEQCGPGYERDTKGICIEMKDL